MAWLKDLSKEVSVKAVAATILVVLGGAVAFFWHWFTQQPLSVRVLLPCVVALTISNAIFLCLRLKEQRRPFMMVSGLPDQKPTEPSDEITDIQHDKHTRR